MSGRTSSPLLAGLRKGAVIATAEPPAPVDLRQVISGLAPMLSRLLPATIQIGLDLDTGAAPVLADQDAIEQMVLNLVTNARDAMPKGGRATIQVRSGARGLRRYGYTVIEAANGVEALERFREQRADLRLIVSDLIMPEMDGLQLLRELRQMSSAIPFLMTTGMVELEASDAGVTGPELSVLSKPWTLEQMLTGVRRTIDGLPLR